MLQIISRVNLFKIRGIGNTRYSYEPRTSQVAIFDNIHVIYMYMFHIDCYHITISTTKEMNTNQSRLYHFRF